MSPGTRLELQGTELHHAARVARVRAGERVEILDGRGAAAEAIVVEATRDRVLVEVTTSVASRESPVEVVLAAALIAPDKFELVLQKGCELGVARIIPMITTRVETRVERIRGKLERWERIILEATKQCGRAVVPRLDEPTDLVDVLAKESNIVAFDADADHDAWPQPDHDRLTLLIGPEGGLTSDELDTARRAGASVCPLGPRRLRAETAAIVAITMALSRYGDLR